VDLICRHYLLAASGINSGATLRDLHDFSSEYVDNEKVQRPIAPDTDVETYLANLQTQSTLALIADGLKRSANDFDSFLAKNVNMEWDAQRMKIYEHFGLVSKKEGVDGTSVLRDSGAFGRSSRRGLGQSNGAGMSGSVFGTSRLQKSVLGAPAAIGGAKTTLFADVADKGVGNAGTMEGRFLREKQEKFSLAVARVNDRRLAGKPAAPLAEFCAVEKQNGVADVVSFAQPYSWAYF
jgi:nuclear pore complex protein Nup93